MCILTTRICCYTSADLQRHVKLLAPTWILVKQYTHNNEYYANLMRIENEI